MGANKPLIKLFLACRASNDITYISETLRAINSPLFLRKKKRTGCNRHDCHNSFNYDLLVGE